jgi:ABC-type multidrug transport system fused ATPase/permease subunit
LRYRPDTEIVLDDLSFEVRTNEKIGIVGRTGSGKSTICISISRIVEIFKGSILIDGVDISQLELNYLRKRITVIPQDPILFKGTIRYNLDPGDNLGTEQLLKAFTLTGLDYELDKEISENGSNLSSGEKQLICICRAILRESKVVILDEATSNIDIVTEQRI